MKKTILTFLILATVCFPRPGVAESRYKNSVWNSNLTNGVLRVQGSGYSSWGRQWVTVDSGVIQYWEAGTSKGPVIIYAKSQVQWFVVQLNYATGAKQNPRNFNQPVSLVRTGAYGVILKVGNTCFDYSWNNLSAIRCR